MCIRDRAKTKPTQHSVKELRSIGIQPDMIVCRSEIPLGKEITDKISLFCDTEPQGVIQLPDVDNIFRIPLVLASQSVDKLVVEHLSLIHI